MASASALTTLPASLDPRSFADARSAEIALLQREIEESKFRGTRRTFQTLPRALRRRAASHNIKRLPVRLRQKALEEYMKDSSSSTLKKKTTKKPAKRKECRRKRRRAGSIVEEFGRRQKDKVWLETHVWHAKRAHMTTIWGHRLATRPNEKCIKACFQASRSGCFMHDESYFGCMEIGGDYAGIGMFLKSCVSTEALSRMQQHVFCENGGGLITDIYAANQYPRGMLGPVDIICKPCKESCQERTIWIWSHPASFQAIYSLTIELAAKFLLSVIDLRGNLTRISLQGSQSIDKLQSVLRYNCLPVEDSTVAADKTIKTTYGNVQDPRFAMAPTKFLYEDSSSISCSDEIALEEGDPLIWDADVRLASVENRKSEKQLNDLRSKHAIPGTPLRPTSLDPKAPIAILQSSYGCTLILPKGWAHCFWRALAFMGARFGGLEESRRHLFENGRPGFPYDAVGTEAYDGWASRRAEEEQAKYNRKPPAKRTNHAKFGIASPFKPLFSALVKGSPWLLPAEEASKLLTMDEAVDPTALVSCSITSQGRGIPKEGAAIYCPSTFAIARLKFDEAIAKFEKSDLLDTQAAIDLLESHDAILREQPPPMDTWKTSEVDIIGHVTTGGFSLARGCGFGIGACIADRIVKMQKSESDGKRPIVLYRNINTWDFRVGYLEIIGRKTDRL